MTDICMMSVKLVIMSIKIKWNWLGALVVPSFY